MNICKTDTCQKKATKTGLCLSCAMKARHKDPQYKEKLRRSKSSKAIEVRQKKYPHAGKSGPANYPHISLDDNPRPNVEMAISGAFVRVYGYDPSPAPLQWVTS